MMSLTIGKDGFSLPLELVTSTQAILARKRSGKSYTASVEAEELLEAGQQVVVIDPTSAWHGLRSSADGEGPGYSVVVFGGSHADAPLEPSAGRQMAAAVVDLGFSAIFDIKSFETDDQFRFVMDFVSELLRINTVAMHLFIDEADTYAPQKTRSKLQFACLGAVTRLVSQGGIGGVGVTLITQRSAKLSWDVLSQIDVLTVLRMGAPNDVKPVTAWLESEVSKEFADEVRAALPSLPVGTAFVASAALGIGERVEVRTRRTFNSGATPRPGERRAEPKVLAAVDIARLGKEIAASVERIKADSPEFLRKRIAELEKAGKGSGSAENGRELARLQVEVDRLTPLADKAERLTVELRQTRERNAQILSSLRALYEGNQDNKAPSAQQHSTASAPIVPSVVKRSPPAKPELVAAPVVSEGLSTSEQKILDALASLEAVGVAAPSKTQLAAFAGYSNPKSGGFAAPAAALVRKGMMESNGGKASMTDAGRDAANKPGRPATTKELQERIFALLGEGERKLLTLLIAAYPESLPRVELARQGGYSNAKSGGFAGPLARLVGLGFADAVKNGVVRGSEMLFLKGKARAR